MKYNKANETIIDGIDELSKFKDTSNLDHLSAGTSRRKRYIISEVVKQRVVILLRDYVEKIEWYYPKNNPYSSSITLEGMEIIAPKKSQIIIVGGKRVDIDCPENDVSFYEGGIIVTRHNPGLVQAEGCQDITAHENNRVIVNGNGRAYTKWNNEVIARGNKELFIFHNSSIDVGNEIKGKEGLGGNISINPGHGGIKSAYTSHSI